MDYYMKQLEEQGFVVIPNYIPINIVDKLKLALNIKQKKGTCQLRKGDLLKRDEIFCKMLTDYNVKGIVNAYLGENAKCATWSSNTLFKTSEDHRVYHWHVDYPYHNISPPWMQNARPLSAQVMWVLDDLTFANGGTMIIPKSHLENTTPPVDKSFVDKAIALECPKGSVVISHGAWWHAQGINTTDQSRTVLLSTYVPRWIVSKDNLIEQFHKLPKEWQTEELQGVL